MNCTGWNLVKLFKCKQLPYIYSKFTKKLNEMEKFRKKINYYKSPFNELYFFISPGLKYLGMNEHEKRKAKRRHYYFQYH